MATTVILANHKTNQRVIAHVGIKEEIRGLMIDLSSKLGGDWVYIQDLKPYEVIPFDCPEKYLGFDNRASDDYCGNIIKLK